MPQTLQVVLCVKCKSFQVQIVKKENKWVCKICNTKQSVQQVYCKGSGAECRNIVIQLNQARGNQEEKKYQENLEKLQSEQEGDFQEDSDCYFLESENGNDRAPRNSEEEEGDLLTQPSGILIPPPSKSKWTVYLD